MLQEASRKIIMFMTKVCFLQIYKMSQENITRSDSIISGGSIESFNSDDLEDTSTYSEAPRDIFEEVEGLGTVRVAKAGDSLPKDTKYLSRKGCLIAVKFRYQVISLSFYTWSMLFLGSMITCLLRH